MSYRIPFNRPSLVGREYEYIAGAIGGGHASGDGPFTRRCEAELAEILGCPRVLLTTSCTHALEAAALLLDIEPGDEVILPSFTFVSTANAFALRGAKLVFADIRPDTLNIDETKLAALCTDRTRAVVVVHYGGVGCEMKAIVQIANFRGIAVIEDNAHGLLGTYENQMLGTFGRLAGLSFHETKNFSCGEGGALVINDPELISRAEIIRDKGADRARFFRGEVDKYTWQGLGSSYCMSDLLAAFLLAQLEGRQHIQSSRAAIWQRYHEQLAGWADNLGVTRPTIPANCGSSHHLYHLLMPTPESRAGLIAHLKQQSILAVFHYLPLHLSPMGRRFGGKPGDCPVTEDISDRLVRLPFYNDLSDADQSRVIDAVRTFKG